MCLKNEGWIPWPYCFTQRKSSVPKQSGRCTRLSITKDIKQLKSFVGLASYYSPNFSSVARPQRTLTRKTVHLTGHQTVSQHLINAKDYLMKPFISILRFFTTLHAKNRCLYQWIWCGSKYDNLVDPIAYPSWTLLPHETNYGISQLERFAIVWAVKHCDV